MSTKFSIKNAKELNEQLAGVFADLRSETIDTKTAVAAAKVTDSIIRNVKNQLDYKKLTGHSEEIEFLK